MKKIIALLLAVVMCFSISACGSESSTPEAPEEPAEESQAAPENSAVYALGDSVETDILKITLNNAELAIKLDTTTAMNYFTADTYDPDKDVGEHYVANKGHTYVVIEYLAENLDRGSVQFDGVFTDHFLTVEYNGETYTGETEYGARSENGYEWEEYDALGVLLTAGTSEYYRCYIDIPVEANDLADDFDLIFSLPKSDGTTEDYRYAVKAADREAIKNTEISLDAAIAYFASDDGIEYFTNHLDEFNILSGEDINSEIIGKKWSVIEKLSNGYWAGDFDFETSGSIEETIEGVGVGYFNNRTWSVSGDELILSSVLSSGKEEIVNCEVRSVSDGVYLLVADGEPFAILQ